MHWIDWLIVAIPLFVVAGIGLHARRYVRSVSDFLAGGRVAGRYVICVASAEASMGLITVVAIVEKYYAVGFAVSFWQAITAPIGIIILLTGFAIYRYRETRAMTLAQFFEIRYGKSLRIFAGVLQAVSGIINYGLFPAVGARFLIYYCQFPLEVEFLGYHWPTFALLMAGFLTIAVIIVTMGGQVTAMTTDCLLGIISYPMYLIVVVAILWQFSWWEQMSPAMLTRPEGKSMLDPFDTHLLRDFNLFFIVVGIVGGIYNKLSWSGTQGYNAAAATAHEQKMGAILGSWRGGFSAMMFILLAAAAYTYMHADAFQTRAAATDQALSWKVLNDISPHADRLQVTATSETISARVDTLSVDEAQTYRTIRNQMIVPAALRDFLPIGVVGVFCAVMVFALISTDTTYMHSWGSIIVQDVILPLRKAPFSPRQHLWVLRLAIVFVAVFAFFFSLLYGQVTQILMFFALTGSVWLGGAGAVILGGLYWKRGTNAGAWAALLTGSGMAVLGFIGLHYWAGWIYPLLEQSPTALRIVTQVVEGISYPFEPIIIWRVNPLSFPLNGQEVYFLTMLAAVTAYVVVSLLTYKVAFNMDRMLHRGAYRRDDELAKEKAIYARGTKPVLHHFQTFQRVMFGIDEQFTRGDKILSWSVFIWSLGWGFGTWLIVTLWNIFVGRWSAESWSMWFFVQNIIVASVVGVVSTVWFTWGGTRDLRRMFRRLESLKRDDRDDGRVVDNLNADDIELLQSVANGSSNASPDSASGPNLKGSS